MERFSDTFLKDKKMKLAPLIPGHYEYGEFVRCDFSEMDLRGFSFTECEFIGCDMSNANIYGVGFRDVSFKECKMLGLDFEHCDAFGLGFTFEDGNLSYANFSGCKMKKMKFIRCKMNQCDFSRADLSESQFDVCDLGDATFFQSILESADLSTSFNFIIDPTQNRIRKMKIAMESLPGLVKCFGVEIGDSL
jgi:fluoroquinolone resistance protein